MPSTSTTGKPVRNDALPIDGKPRAANDLAIAENGDVYVTDSLGSGIYRIPAGGGALETFVAPGAFRSPGGIAFGPGGRIYVADWGQGLYWLDAERKPHEVEGPPDVPLFGIDGLLARGQQPLRRAERDHARRASCGSISTRRETASSARRSST